MTVPLDVRNDIRSMDSRGVPRAEIARELHLSRNTVARYADMEDLSPAPPLPEERPRPALEEHVAWVDAVLEADLGAPCVPSSLFEPTASQRREPRRHLS